LLTGLSVPHASAILNDIQNAINNPKYDYIIYTMDTHIIDDYQHSDEKLLFPDIHCEWKTPGWNFYNIQLKNKKEFEKELSKQTKQKDSIFSNEAIFPKDKFDIWTGNKNYKEFFNNKFDKKIQIDVCGVALNYCVFQHVIGLVENGYKNITILENGVKGITHFPNGVEDVSFNENRKIMEQKNIRFKD
jgi:nicotinamidase-related amidase